MGKRGKRCLRRTDDSRTSSSPEELAELKTQHDRREELRANELPGPEGILGAFRGCGLGVQCSRSSVEGHFPRFFTGMPYRASKQSFVCSSLGSFTEALSSARRPGDRRRSAGPWTRCTRSGIGVGERERERERKPLGPMKQRRKERRKERRTERKQDTNK